jgi:hypothetical protein
VHVSQYEFVMFNKFWCVLLSLFTVQSWCRHMCFRLRRRSCVFYNFGGVRPLHVFSELFQGSALCFATDVISYQLHAQTSLYVVEVIWIHWKVWVLGVEEDLVAHDIFRPRVVTIATSSQYIFEKSIQQTPYLVCSRWSPCSRLGPETMVPILTWGLC